MIAAMLLYILIRGVSVKFTTSYQGVVMID